MEVTEGRGRGRSATAGGVTAWQPWLAGILAVVANLTVARVAWVSTGSDTGYHVDKSLAGWLAIGALGVTALLGLIVMSIRARRQIGLALLAGALASLVIEFVEVVVWFASIPD